MRKFGHKTRRLEVKLRVIAESERHQAEAYHSNHSNHTRLFVYLSVEKLGKIFGLPISDQSISRLRRPLSFRSV